MSKNQAAINKELIDRISILEGKVEALLSGPCCKDCQWFDLEKGKTEGLCYHHNPQPPEVMRPEYCCDRFSRKAERVV